ncbi:MAG: TetR/AcrR family transcriptional regulator [Imperialibacter sp.]
MSPRTKAQIEEIREQSREKIIAAALDLFAHSGFHSTSIAQVAAKAGISKGLIYNYFQSKEDLLQAIFTEAMKNSEDILTLDPKATAKQRLIGMAKASADFMYNNQEYMRLFLTLMMQPDVVKSMKPWFDTVGKAKKDMLMPMFEEIFPGRAEVEYFFFGAIMDGIGFGYLVLGREYPFEEVKRKFIDYIQNQ